ncbi:MAG: BatA domain-containing protein [Verrucomicrobiae bacterium]|nr:BatA domain-containing protein [Verrucomicrobiae bacterium]
MTPLSFLNPLMLWGLAAIAAPIIIHLLNRQRFRVVRWGAMMFLRESLKKARRKLRIQHWLLLLVRVLILALLALALARPLVKTAFTASLGHGRTDMVLVLDCSFSTAWGADGASDFENIRRAALSLIDTLRHGDTVSVFLASDSPRPLAPEPSFELQRTKQTLATLQPVPRPANLLRASQDVAAWLAKLRNPNREVYFITDGAAHGWSTDRAEDWERVGAELAKVKPKVIVRVLAVAAFDRPNVAVLDLNIQPRVVAAHNPARASARVANFGRAARDLTATLSVDGVQKATKDVRLEAGETTVLSFTVQFPEPGPHRVVFDVGTDALPLDNRRYLALDALHALPVLIVDGAPNMNAFRSASGFLAAALWPGEESVVRPSVVDARALSAADLSPYRVVVLANVPRVDRETALRLEHFVASGRGLLVAPGNVVETNDYNNVLYQEGRYLLPAKIAGVRVAPDDRPERVSPKALWRADLADLAQAALRRWWRLEPGSGAATLASLAGGDPLLVSRRLGDGRILQTALPLDATWSDLPIHPAFVPFAHEMIYELALTSQASRNLLVGEPSPLAGVKTDEPGAFVSAGRAFAINPNAAESDLAPLTPQQRDQIARWLGATFADNWRELPARLGGERFGMQLWRPFIALALLLAFVETALTSLWSARRPLSEQAAPQLLMNR